MSNTTEQLRRALGAIKKLKAQVAALEGAAHEPIAIIGMGCRFPGADSPAAFWDLLREGVDAIGEVPRDRWDIDAVYDEDSSAAGKMITRYGGFLDDVDRFDPQFFRISPREATHMDPQQRLLLEVCWEALEDATQTPARLSGSQTGVFMGIAGNDYSELVLSRGVDQIDSFVGVGNAHSVAVGRLSFALGLQGPSLAINTACSSSLVAVHLAVQSLRQKECGMALAGGVNVILTPTVSINHSRAQMLAPDGRCKTFDAGADGFSRAEGCGVLVLKRLSDAEADGDDILAVIRGSAVNHDGRTTGITVPNGPSQQAVIRQALRNAGVEAADVGYIEAHGTGTSLGDPIELGALGAVFAGREDRLPVGSVKTNIGHAEAAAGVAGIMKVVLALRNGALPRHLHCNELTPRVMWDELSLRVTTEAEAWKEKRIAGVSSFGFGGTNAHVVLGEGGRRKAEGGKKRDGSGDELRNIRSDGKGGRRKAEGGKGVLVLSGMSEGAVEELVARYEGVLGEGGLGWGDVCATAVRGRGRFVERLAVVAGEGEDGVELLRGWREGRKPLGVARGAAWQRPKVAFLFTGQGSQYEGMGMALYETEPVFREAVEACDAQLSWSLIDVFEGGGRKAEGGKGEDSSLVARDSSFEGGGRKAEGGKEEDSSLVARDSLLDRTEYTQVALFALEYGLARLWLSWGIEPDVVMGHSVGEIAAACVAGLFSLADGMKLIEARGRLMGALPQDGAMMAVFADEATVRSLLPVNVEIGAVNGPNSVVVSGEKGAVAGLGDRLKDAGIRGVSLTVSHAFHSYLMEPMLDEFAAVARQIGYQTPEIEIVSNVSGQMGGAEMGTADYWVRHARQAVRFADGMRTLQHEDVNVLLEIGPKHTLIGMGQRCWGEKDAGWLASLKPQVADEAQMRTALAGLIVNGVEPDWSVFLDDDADSRLRLPTYPFQRQRYWVSGVDATALAIGPRVAQVAQGKGTAETGIESVAGLDYYHLDWVAQARPLVAGEMTPLPAPDEIRARSEGWFQRAAEEDEVVAYGEVLSRLNLLTHDYVVGALERLAGGTRFKLLDLERHTAEIHHKRLPRLLNMLRDAGRAEQVAASGEWQLIHHRRPSPAVDLSMAEFRLLKRCGEQLVDVLKGDLDPIHLLFPNGDMTETSAVYSESPGARLMNGGMQQALREALADWPAGRPLRVLEIGAGTGGATRYILPHLPETVVEYTFTDISAAFLSRAQEQFAEYGFMRYRPLNVELDPAEQGFDNDSFDIVIAFNVLHATQDLGVTMRHVNQLTARNGMVFLLENTIDQDWVEIIWGLSEDWWRFVDTDRRPEQPLLSETEWESLLIETGWRDVSWLKPERDQLAVMALIMGQASDEEELAVAGQRWMVVGSREKRVEGREEEGVATRVEDGLRGIGVDVIGEGTEFWDVDGVVFAPEVAGDWAGVLAQSERLVELVRDLVASGSGATLTVVTERGQMVAGDGAVNPFGGVLWGLGKGIGLEHGEHWGGMIDVAPGLTGGEIVWELFGGSGEDHVAYRPEGRFVARVCQIDGSEKTTDKNDHGWHGEIGGDGVYLVTGGLGGLGLATAEWLVEKGARRLVLMGRRGITNDAVQDRVDGLVSAGVAVEIVAADVANQEEMERVFGELAQGDGRLRGVIHAAGVGGDCLLADMDGEVLAQTMAAKVAGSSILHGLTADLALDFFVCYSSMVSLWGAKRQSHYVAANHFVDLLMGQRQAMGLPGIAINWGPLRAGMYREELTADLNQMGIEMSELDEALGVLDVALAQGWSHVAPVDIDWLRFKQIYEVRGVRPLFALLGDNDNIASSGTENDFDFRTELENMPQSERHSLLQQYIQEVLAQILHFVPPHLPSVRQGLFDLGLDSLTAMELNTKLGHGLGLSLPSTLAFDFGTIAALTDYLLSEIFVAREEEPEAELSVAGDEKRASVSEADLAEMSEEDVEALLMERLMKGR